MKVFFIVKYYHSEKRSKANMLEKRISCVFYLVIAPRYFLEQLFKQKGKELKSDCRSYE